MPTPTLSSQQGIKSGELPSPGAKLPLPNLCGWYHLEQFFLPKITRWQSAIVFQTARVGGWEGLGDPG